MALLRFAKLSGAGNDFIVLDGRGQDLALVTPEYIRQICRPGLAVGADGLMILQPSATHHFVMQYFNADGSEAAMCGNGGRCIARFAVLVGASREGELIRFTAPSGEYTAKVQGNQVQLSLIPPVQFEQDIRLMIAGQERSLDFTNTGVPHAVFFTENVSAEDVYATGKAVRYHERFAPAGTNVNFCQVKDEHHLSVRTYERGVENETLACGTGVAAATLLAARRNWVKSPVTVRTRSGMDLAMTFTATAGGFTGIYQQGEARLVYWGELAEEALFYPEPPDE